MVKIEKLASSYDRGNHIEIEKKYYVDDEKLFTQVLQVLKDYNEYKIEEESSKKQEDYYYDTEEKYLYHNNITVRIRNNKGDYYITIKKPTINSTNEQHTEKTQNERFEYEERVISKDIHDNIEFIIKYIPKLKDKNLKNSLNIINNRREIMLVNKNNDKIKFEMVFDSVEYIGINKVCKKDYQVEIELKSEYTHIVNLNLLTDYLETNINGLKTTLKSKYQRGLEITSS